RARGAVFVLALSRLGGARPVRVERNPASVGPLVQRNRLLPFDPPALHGSGKEPLGAPRRALLRRLPRPPGCRGPGEDRMAGETVALDRLRPRNRLTSAREWL